jgi:Acyl-CoA dehydrogenase, C-terminal domain
MISRAEAVQTWLEHITYQMCHMTYKQMSANLAGPISFLKMMSTQMAQETARDAVQIFGGRAITQSGLGRFIEHYHRTIAFDALLGGGVLIRALDYIPGLMFAFQRRMFSEILGYDKRCATYRRLPACDFVVYKEHSGCLFSLQFFLDCLFSASSIP